MAWTPINMNIKLEASQAHTVYKFQNIKIRLLKTNLHIRFNQECIKYNIIPKYASIKINKKSEFSTKIKRYAGIMWMREELKYLYKKKTVLNRELYRTHLQLLDSVHVALLDNVLQTINKYAHDILCLLYTSRCV